LKKSLIAGCFAAILAWAQEKTTVKPIATQVVAQRPIGQTTGFTGTYSPAKIKILGALNYGTTSGPVIYAGRQRYLAFVFTGYGGDIVDITVKGVDGKAFVAVADSSLNRIISGDTHLSLGLPYKGPDIEVWYIIFRETEYKTAHFTVQVKKIGSESANVRAPLQSLKESAAVDTKAKEVVGVTSDELTIDPSPILNKE
jgi:hypothetical protein